MIPEHARDAAHHSTNILGYWFSTLDDGSRLDRNEEPFRTCFQRWYGKDPAVDADIRERFEPLLHEIVRDGQRMDDVLAGFRQAPGGLLALVILLDQMPRNMYRGTAEMYAHDPFGLAVTMEAIRVYAGDETLPVVQRMFLYVPLMHVENLTLQAYMLGRFDDLVARAHRRSPHNLDFFQFAQDYARRHVEVIAKFGRFPHRNTILKRETSPAEEGFLRDNPGF